MQLYEYDIFVKKLVKNLNFEDRLTGQWPVLFELALVRRPPL